MKDRFQLAVGTFVLVVGIFVFFVVRSGIPHQRVVVLQNEIQGPDHPQARLLFGGRIDINRADEDELQVLPGIGPQLARRIVDERDRFGFFEDVEALDHVRGIGPKILLRLRPLIAANE